MTSFEEFKADWEAHDEWQFADRDAERKFFYAAGAAAMRERCAEVAYQMTDRYDCQPDIASAIRRLEV
jgi:hypothetical protein